MNRKERMRLEKHIEETASFFRDSLSLSESPVLLVSHYDADGLSSVSIITHLLMNLGINSHIRILDQVDDESVSRIKGTSYKMLLFTDMGSAQATLLEGAFHDITLIIIDHHKPGKPEPSQNHHAHEINPHYFNIDGSREISASGLAYLFAKGVEDRVASMAPIALLGALGDRQDIGPRSELIGLNRDILEECINRGLMRERIGLRLSGLNSRSLVKALEYTIDPYIPGLSGNENACLVFLNKIGVDPVREEKIRSFGSLTKNELKKLATSLVRYMINTGVPADEAENIFGMEYAILGEPEDSPLFDAREFASILNGCGRLNNHGTGVGLCLGLRGKIVSDAYSHLSQYRRVLSSTLEGIRSSTDHHITRYDHLIAVDLRQSLSGRVAGAIASIIASSEIIQTDKIVVVLGRSDSRVKLSARFPRHLEKESTSISLGDLMSKVASEYRGYGGGHPGAAGAIIEDENVDPFLKSLDAYVDQVVVSKD